MSDNSIPITVAFIPNTEVGLVFLKPEAVKLLETGKFVLAPAIKTLPTGKTEIVSFAIIGIKDDD